MDSTLTKISRVQFFAVLTPGFFAFSVVVLAVAVTTSSSPDACITWVKEIPEVLWIPTTVFAVFASYMFGSLPRAFSVGHTDELCLRVFHGKLAACLAKVLELIHLKEPNRTSEYHKRMLEGVFPYVEALEHQLVALKLTVLRGNEDIIPQLPPAKTHTAIATFDYWKVALYMNQPHISDFVQSLEARARFFVGMFWATIFGFLTGLYMILVAGVLHNGWLHWAIFCTVFSFCFAFVFGRRLRSARGEEARMVFFAYIECLSAQARSRT